MHLRRIGAAPVDAATRNTVAAYLSTLRLRLQFQQRHPARPHPRRQAEIDEMTHALERRAVIGEVGIGERTQGIRSFQTLQHLGIEIQQRHAPRRPPSPRAATPRPTPRVSLSGGQVPQLTPVGHQEIADIVLHLHVVQPPQQRLHAAQHGAQCPSARAACRPDARAARPTWLSSPRARGLPVFIHTSYKRSRSASVCR